MYFFDVIFFLNDYENKNMFTILVHSLKNWRLRTIQFRMMVGMSNKS